MTPNVPAPAPRAARGGYEGTALSADRQPELQVVVTIDADGWVIGGAFVRGGDFNGCMKKTKSLYLFDRADIVWPNGMWPVDAEGRGLSVLEVENGEHLSTKVAA